MVSSKAIDRWDTEISDKSCSLSNAIDMDKKKPNDNILAMVLIKNAICRERNTFAKQKAGCIEDNRTELTEEYKANKNSLILIANEL